MKRAICIAGFALLLAGCPPNDDEIPEGPLVLLEDRPIAVDPSSEVVYATVQVENEQELYAIDPDTATPTLARQLPGLRDIRLFFPEDRTLMVRGQGAFDGLELLNPDTHTTTLSADPRLRIETVRLSPSGRFMLVETPTFGQSPLQLFDTASLQNIGLPEAETGSMVALWAAGDRLLVAQFEDAPQKRVRVRLWEAAEVQIASGQWPEPTLDVSLDDFERPEAFDTNHISINPSGTLAAIPLTIETLQNTPEPVPDLPADAGMGSEKADDVPAPDPAETPDPEPDFDAEMADVELEDVVEDVPPDIPEEDTSEDATPDDAEDEDIEEEDVIEPEDVGDPPPPMKVLEARVVVLDLRDGALREVQDASGPTVFGPEGATLFAQRIDTAGPQILRIDTASLALEVLQVPLGMGLRSAVAAFDGQIVWRGERSPETLLVFNMETGGFLTIEAPEGERAERLDAGQFWIADGGLFRVDLSVGVAEQLDLNFRPTRVSRLPRRDLLAVNNRGSGEIVFVEPSSGRVVQRARVVAEATPDACQTKLGAAPVTGRWVLSGKGSRTGCTNPVLDTDEFVLGSKPLNVSVTSGTDPARGTLGLQNPAPEFDFSGGVEGICVRFAVSEAVGSGERMELRFSGTYNASLGAVEGSFNGSGPEGCLSEGRFRAQIQ